MNEFAFVESSFVRSSVEGYAPHQCARCHEQTRCRCISFPLLSALVPLWFCQPCSEHLVEALTSAWKESRQ